MNSLSLSDKNGDGPSKRGGIGIFVRKTREGREREMGEGLEAEANVGKRSVIVPKCKPEDRGDFIRC